MRKSLYVLPLILLVILYSSPQAFSQVYKTFETNHTTVYYSQDSQLGDFLWRISRLKLTPTVESSLAKNRVDRIVELTEATLDMYPENFHIDIFLRSGYKEGDVAFYSKETKSITIFADRVTDGVLAHEVAHAVMNAYFKTPPPSKIQELLCQYTDKHLWQEYR